MTLPVEKRDQLIAGPYTRLLAEHETAVASVYEVLANLLKDSASFWRGLAEEELDHRRLIEAIDEKFHDGEWAFKRPTVITKGIAEAIEWLEAKSRDVESNGISMRDALQAALEIEVGMIERKFFEVIAADTPEMKKVVSTLAAYTEDHAKRLQAEAARLKWKITGSRRVRPT